MISDELRKKLRQQRNRLKAFRYYLKNKDRITAKNYIDRHGTLRRYCAWCKKDITHLKPRSIKFCCSLHRIFYEKERKKMWRLKRLKSK